MFLRCKYNGDNTPSLSALRVPLHCTLYSTMYATLRKQFLTDYKQNITLLFLS